VLPLAGNAITNDIREGCNILKKQAESLKIKFGSCLVSAASENDVIAIPGIRSQAPREIYVKTLAGIINARTRMILEQVDYSIKVPNYHKKLIAGIALTGGGAQLKNIKEFCELITATDTRSGIPNEHLDTSSVAFDELAHPMYATGIGLVIEGISRTEHADRMERLKGKEAIKVIPKEEEPIEDTEALESEDENIHSRRRKPKKEKTHKEWNLTQIITKFFSADEINE
jgi:cell division protein FtsA